MTSRAWLALAIVGDVFVLALPSAAWNQGVIRPGWELAFLFAPLLAVFLATATVAHGLWRAHRDGSGWWPRWAAVVAAVGLVLRAVVLWRFAFTGAAMLALFGSGASLLVAAVRATLWSPPTEPEDAEKTRMALAVGAGVCLALSLVTPTLGSSTVSELLSRRPLTAFPTGGTLVGFLIFIPLVRTREPIWRIAGISLSGAALVGASLLLVERNAALGATFWLLAPILLGASFWVAPTIAPAALGDDGEAPAGRPSSAMTLIRTGYAVYGVSLLVPAVEDFAGLMCALLYWPAYWLNIALVLMAVPFWRLRVGGNRRWRTIGLLLALGALGHQLVIGIQLADEGNLGDIQIGYYLWCTTSVLFACAFRNATPKGAQP